MQIGLERDLEKVNEALDRIQIEVDGLKGIIAGVLKEQKPEIKPEEKIKEAEKKRVGLAHRNIRRLLR